MFFMCVVCTGCMSICMCVGAHTHLLVCMRVWVDVEA